jgi:hypothetical protein
MRLVHFGVRSGICHYTFCRLSFVFIQIPGGSFIFDIFLVPVGPVPDLQTHVGEPPQLVQAGIFHPAFRALGQPPPSCLLPTVLLFAPAASRG